MTVISQAHDKVIQDNTNASNAVTAQSKIDLKIYNKILLEDPLTYGLFHIQI